MTAPSLTNPSQGVSIISADQLSTYEQWCQTISQLRAFAPNNNMQVWVEGQNAVADGGQGVFWWNSTISNPVDDNFNTIVPNGSTQGAWIRETAYGGQTPGSTSNDNASTGNIGEYQSISVTSGSSVGLTTNTAANITSLTLTAGDWDAWGMVSFQAGSSATTLSSIAGWIGSTSATNPGAPNNGAFIQLTTSFTTGSGQSVSVGSARFSVVSGTTIYLGAQATFGVSTLSAFGFIGARRRR